MRMHKVEIVPLKDIEFPSWTPDNRIDDQALEDLKESYAVHNDVVRLPVVFLQDSGKYKVIDGVRQVLAAKANGAKSMEVVVRARDLEPERLKADYVAVNTNQRNLTVNDKLGVYLKDPTVINGAFKRQCEDCEKLCGRAQMRWIYRTRVYGIDLFVKAKEVVTAADRDLVNVPLVLGWLLKYLANQSVAYLRTARRECYDDDITPVIDPGSIVDMAIAGIKPDVNKLDRQIRRLRRKQLG